MGIQKNSKKIGFSDKKCGNTHLPGLTPPHIPVPLEKGTTPQARISLIILTRQSLPEGTAGGKGFKEGLNIPQNLSENQR
jgi:hypothetical protein